MNFQNQRDGEHRKDVAFVLLEVRRECYVREARRALLDALLANGIATADDVRARVELPKGINPKTFGAVPSVLARAGIIRRDGFTRSTRPEAHARPVSVWRLADPAAAQRWLASHRPLPPMTTAADFSKDDLSKSETPPTPFAEEQVNGVSMQSTLPGFNEKESTHG